MDLKRWVRLLIEGQIYRDDGGDGGASDVGGGCGGDVGVVVRLGR